MREALAVCQAGVEQARAFVAGLTAADLLVERRAEIAALPESVVVDWHRRGWLALVHTHPLSQRRWGLLIDLAASDIRGRVES